MMLLRQWLVCLSVYYLSKGMAHTSHLVPLGNFVEVTLKQSFRSKSYWTKFLVQTIYSLSGIFGKNLIHRVPFGKWCAIILSKMSRFKTLVKNPCWNLIFLALSGSCLCLLVKDVQWAMTCNQFKFLSQKQRSKQIFFLSPLYYFGQTLPKDCI